MDSEKKKKFDPQLIAVIFVYVVAALYFIASFQIESAESRLFPRIICGLGVFLASIYLIQIIRGKANDAEVGENPFAGTGRAGIMCLLLIMYILLNYLAGYYVATLIFFPVTMLFLGQRKWSTIVITTVAYPLVVYLIFDLLLKMQMPEGLLFK